jgi:ubiquinone/menaquinone biosynthesis C-methylase UbiE
LVSIDQRYVRIAWRDHVAATHLDRWAQWLLHDRHGGDERSLRNTLEWLAPVRDKILADAEVGLDDVVLDVGSGDGLVGFGALPLVGDSGGVVFTDISEELLAGCRSVAADIGVTNRCRFVNTPAETLAGVQTGSVDVVTTRSVLIYVQDKKAAFEAFRRGLRPRGGVEQLGPLNRQLK